MTDDRTEETPKSYRPIDAKGFREFISRGWGPVDRSVTLPEGLAEAAAEHRQKLSAALPGRRIAVAAGRAPVRSNDTDYQFRADSDFVWLTGCQAEGAVLVLSADGDATVEDVGWELFRLMLDVASGRKRTWAEQHRLHNALVLFNPAPVT